jgi:hypothetical protein
MMQNPGETPTPDEPPHEPPQPTAWRPEDMSYAADHIKPKPPQSGLDGCLTVVGKIVLTLFIGIFLLGGLVFATCFLSMRR